MLKQTKWPPLTLLLLLSCFISCQNNNIKCARKEKINNGKAITPKWVKQNIDSASACKIVLCDNIKLIKIGNSYTATYTFTDVKETWFKVNKQSTYLDFAPSDRGVQYFKDSCQLKEDLRAFMKLQIVKYISSHLEADTPK